MIYNCYRTRWNVTVLSVDLKNEIMFRYSIMFRFYIFIFVRKINPIYCICLVISHLPCLFLPQISYVDIPGLGNRRIKRHLTINHVQNMVICWWSAAKDELWPWSPVSSKRERANLLLLKCEHGNLEVIL